MSGRVKRKPSGQVEPYDLDVESIPREVRPLKQYIPGTHFGEEIGLVWADDANLKAIAEYIVNQRVHIPQYPKLLPIIQNFERWYQGLGWLDVHVMINDTVKEARRYRQQVNDAMDLRIPDDWIPGDVNPQAHDVQSTIFQTPPPPPPPPPLIPTKYKTAAAVGGGVVVALALLKFLAGFSPAGLAKKAFSR